jgi:outer membrane lipoprotein-sorting protein
MKLSPRYLAIPLLLSASYAFGQIPDKEKALTAKQVIEASIKACGGKKALDTPKSCRMSFTLELVDQGIKGEGTVLTKGDKDLATFTVPEMGSLRMGYDGKTKWADDPFSGLHKVSPKEEGKAKDGEDDPFSEFTFGTPIMDLNEFAVVQLKGIEKVGDRPAYVIRMKTKKGKSSVRYYDCKSFMLVKESHEAKDGSLKTQTVYGDYRRISGYCVPFHMSLNVQGMTLDIRVTDCKMDVPIDDAVFAFPGGKKSSAAKIPGTQPNQPPPGPAGAGYVWKWYPGIGWVEVPAG